MNKKSLYVLLSLFLVNCSNNINPVSPNNTTPVVSSSSNTQVTNSPTIIPSVIPEEKVIKPYSMNIDLNNNFDLAKDIPISNSITGKINEKGDGLIIFQQYALKIINFKPSGDKKLIDTDFGGSSLSINENGDGIVYWSPAPRFTTDNLTANVYKETYKYKKIKNLELSEETFETNFNPLGNMFYIDENGRGKVVLRIREIDNTLYKLYEIEDFKITDNSKYLFLLPENNLVRLDDHGNGIIMKRKFSNNDDSVEINVVKNYVINQKNYNLSQSNNDDYDTSYTSKTHFDSNGNGFISWSKIYTSSYDSYNQKSEIFIRKVENFIPVGNDISLGTDYSGGIVTLDKNGTGFVTWQKEFGYGGIYTDISDVAYTRFRKIKNFIPESKAYNLSLNSSNGTGLKFRYNLNVLKNSYGDGILLWQEFTNNSSGNYNGDFYARPFENYNISNQNLNEYIPQPKPTPTPTPMPSSTPPYAFTPDGKPVEIATVNGNIYDQTGNIVNDTEIKINVLSDHKVDIPVNIVSSSSPFVIRNIPVGEIEIVVSKQGYKTRTRKVNVVSNQQGIPTVNQFNFGGTNEQDKDYFLEKE